MTATTTTGPPDRLGTRGGHSLTDVLVGCLLNAGLPGWPGGDGILVADVLDEYPRAAAAGLVSGELDLCRRYPAMSAQIIAFFFIQTAGCHD